MYSYDRRAKDQMGELADEVSRLARALYTPKWSFNELAKKVVQTLLKNDDGSMLGAVYHDGFNRNRFMQTLALKLRGIDKNAPQIAEAITMELENQR